MKKRIFAFDMGKASIGYAIREDNKIKAAGSIIIDPDHGEIASKRDRRRNSRTLLAHKSREAFLKETWQKCNLEVLKKDDEKFKKEFPSKNETTIYTSCLLRIALPQNKPLENWQIYKALHNAIQKRGYDPDVPWKTDQSEDDRTNIELIKKYTQENNIELINSDEFKYPCYYDALRLGLWSEDKPYRFNRSIPFDNFNKVRSTKYVHPRKFIVKELCALWKNAQKQISELEKISVEEFLYGNYKEAYGSYKNPYLKKYRGKKEDWTGVLGQKIPRFDNRIISKCRLLPKRNVCSANCIENVTTVLLMKLKNLRLKLSDIEGNKISLSSENINQIYNNWLKKMQEKGKLDATITQKEIEKVIGVKLLGKIEPMSANISKRSSFCRRACNIINKIILEGIEPAELDINEFLDSKGTKDGIFEEEIRQMLSRIGNWENLYISYDKEKNNQDFDSIRTQTDLIIGNITNSIVKNRLQIFRDLLFHLIEKYDIADEIIFEFPRDDSLYSTKRVLDWQTRVKNNKKQNETIAKELEGINKLSPNNIIKIKLLQQQTGKCIYSGKSIGMEDLDRCEIDHIYPRTKKGNDALTNKVLCYSEYNQQKGARTPYEWLYNTENWGAYLNRVNSLKESLGKGEKDSSKNLKFQLLISPPEVCEELIDSYRGLAETGYIASVAQQICSVVFEWGLGEKGKKRHIFVNNGRNTSQIRKKYELNSLLGNSEEKNRDNDKHHALDAICISFSRDYKNGHIEGFDKKKVENAINKIIPYPYSHKKPLKKNTNPLETIYGKRVYDTKACIVNRVNITSIEQKTSKIESIVDSVIKNDLLEKLSCNLDKKA